MDRNLWLAVTLSVGVYAAWFGFFEKRFNPPPVKPAAIARSPASVLSAATSAPSVAPAATSPLEDAKTVFARSETVSIGDATARIHPRGAAIVSFLYPEPLGRVELVLSPDPGLFATFPELEFKRDPSVKNGLVYGATRPDGLNISKEFLSGAGTVLPRVRIVATNPTRRAIDAGAWTLTVGPGLGTIATELNENADLLRAIALTPAVAGPPAQRGSHPAARCQPAG